MTMLERAARAITRKRAGLYVREGCFGPHAVDAWVDANWQNHKLEARAAIEAMREPTDAMVAEPDQLTVIGCCLPDRSEATELYQAMIDKALEE